MHPHYQVNVLRAVDVARAYAVVQHLVPNVDFAEWQAATSNEDLRNKWLTVSDMAGVIRGLCLVFASGGHIDRQLEVPVFASISLIDEHGVAKHLLEHARRRAEEEKCDRIHFWSAGKMDRALLRDCSHFEAPPGGLIYDLRSSRQPSPR